MTDASTETSAVAAEAQKDRLENERAFLAILAKQDKGRLAVLRRNAGNSLCEARGVAWVHGLLSKFSKPWGEEAYFLVATLFASDKDAIDGRNGRGDFGATLRALKSKAGTPASDSNPLDRRFNILLDADFDLRSGGELAFRLRQLTKLVISKKDPTARVNWPQLLHDVKQWNHVRKYSQKQWARSYYAPMFSSSEDTETESVINTNPEGDL